METSARLFHPLLPELTHRLRVLVRATPDHSNENVAFRPRHKNAAGIVAPHLYVLGIVATIHNLPQPSKKISFPIFRLQLERAHLHTTYTAAHRDGLRSSGGGVKLAPRLGLTTLWPGLLGVSDTLRPGCVVPFQA